MKVVMPASLLEILLRDSAISRRTETNQVLWILEEYYRGKEREARLFCPEELVQGKPGEVPVLRTTDPLPPGPVSRLHGSLGPDES